MFFLCTKKGTSVGNEVSKDPGNSVLSISFFS
nr:MAG TPA: hypothetical protein [Caudoviricetes sp.]